MDIEVLTWVADGLTRGLKIARKIVERDIHSDSFMVGLKRAIYLQRIKLNGGKRKFSAVTTDTCWRNPTVIQERAVQKYLIRALSFWTRILPSFLPFHTTCFTLNTEERSDQKGGWQGGESVCKNRVSCAYLFQHHRIEKRDGICSQYWMRGKSRSHSSPPRSCSMKFMVWTCVTNRGKRSGGTNTGRSKRIKLDSKLLLHSSSSITFLSIFIHKEKFSS